MNRYMSGTLVVVTAAFLNAAGVPTSPTTVVLKYRKDAGSTTSVTPTAGTAGVYTYNLDTTGWTGPDDQLWTYEFIGTGTVQAIGSNTFGVYAPTL